LTIKNGYQSATTTVGSLNLAAGVSQTVASLDADRTSFIALGNNSTLTISGPGSSIYENTFIGGTNSTVAVAGGHSLVIGSLNSNGTNGNTGDPLHAQPATTTSYSTLNRQPLFHAFFARCHHVGPRC
jgi:hypothetical protein